MSEQEPVQTATQPKPVPEGYETWNEYWTKEHHQPWRTEPEITEERQQYLAERRAIKPDIDKGIYPFRDKAGSIKLTRADVEWLLATHDGGRGPVDGNYPADRTRTGLDLRGADVRATDLTLLPLARLVAGFPLNLRFDKSTDEQRESASIHLERANLRLTHLEGAVLNAAHLEQAALVDAHLERASLVGAHLEAANLVRTYFDANTTLNGAHLGNRELGFASVRDARWNGVNLRVVDWRQLRRLGDEQEVNRPRRPSRTARADGFEAAALANEQLAAVLRAQGLPSPAILLSYRALVLRRSAMRLRFQYVSWLGSSFQDLLWGYGYRPMRSVSAYIAVVLVYAVAYFRVGQAEGDAIDWKGALVLSMTSFHGRGFFPGITGVSGVASGDTLAVLAATEALLGVIVEAFFIAALTRSRSN